jgi:hypothetical protein
VTTVTLVNPRHYSSHAKRPTLQMLPKEAAMSTPRPRPVILALTALVVTVALGLLGLLVPAAASAAPRCDTTWGSLSKVNAGNQPVTGTVLSDVRAGRHACYDRLVLDIRGATSFHSWRVEYVPQVRQEASGRPLPLRGGAFLQIAVGASDHTTSGALTYHPVDRRELVDVAGFRTFRQVAWAGSFEGISQIGLGVRARLPFRVFALAGTPATGVGARVVIDVAHQWQR